MSHLFEPLKIRGVTLRNRIGVSPMCQYSSVDGFASDWHLVHLGSRAVGGAALVIAEATGVEARGRISPNDLGIYKDEHIEGHAKVARFVTEHGAVPGIQIAHAGRKASTGRPWEGGKLILPEHGGWQPVGPAPEPFAPGYAIPVPLDQAGINQAIQSFRAAAQRSLEAGYRWLEIHAAHGYLLHSFCSPLSNTRTDGYGGSFENRVRLVLEITRSVREVWPEDLPLGVRISSTDWVEGGWALEDSVELSRLLKVEGVDLVDCSSGGVVAVAPIPVGPNYQVPFAEEIRRRTGVLTGAVGFITEPKQADEIIRNERADVVFLARQFLRDPYWPIHAAIELGQAVPAPAQYVRAFPAPK